MIGNSPGVTTVTDQYIFNAGMLAIELAGSSGVAGTDFDRAETTGPLSELDSPPPATTVVTGA